MLLLNPEKNYRPEIDGLRAIAVLSVIVFHAFPLFLPGGYLGVDVFFVLSGFLITMIMNADLDHESFILSEFYIRRIKRILPGLLIVLFSVILAACFLLMSTEFFNLSKHLLAASTFSSNYIYLKEEEGGYFAISSELKPLLHLWSLGVEEQFYIIFPFIFAFIFKWKKNICKLLVI